MSVPSTPPRPSAAPHKPPAKHGGSPPVDSPASPARAWAGRAVAVGVAVGAVLVLVEIGRAAGDLLSALSEPVTVAPSVAESPRRRVAEAAAAPVAGDRPEELPDLGADHPLRPRKKSPAELLDEEAKRIRALTDGATVLDPSALERRREARRAFRASLSEEELAARREARQARLERLPDERLELVLARKDTRRALRDGEIVLPGELSARDQEPASVEPDRAEVTPPAPTPAP
jgi:hypothetical protein